MASDRIPSHLTSESRPFQVIEGRNGDWEIHVARHAAASTFTFDVIAPIAQVTETATQRAIACHNMTRAQLEEHIERCQAALAEVRDGD